MGFLNQIYGSTPKVPKLEEIDPLAEQKKAIEGNIEALPGAQDLVGQANLFSRQQIDEMLASAGGGSLLKDWATTTGSMIRGEVPLADQQMQQLRSVAKSFGGGTAGSGAMGNLVARDLGLQQLDLVTKGLSSAENWLRTTAALYEPSMINVSSMFLTPAQLYQMENEQNVQQFQRNWMKEQVGALPDPVLAGINADIQALMQSFLGGMGSKMGV